MMIQKDPLVIAALASALLGIAFLVATLGSVKKETP
jgi:hypothetical protein